MQKMKGKNLMRQRMILFLVLTGVLFCTGCAGKRPSEQGELVRTETAGENPAVFFALRRYKKMVILYLFKIKNRRFTYG